MLYDVVCVFFFLMIRRPPRSTQSRSSAASDVYKRQLLALAEVKKAAGIDGDLNVLLRKPHGRARSIVALSLIHISEPTRLLSISYAVFCLKKKNKDQ
mgnify:CR=1 FL=1